MKKIMFGNSLMLLGIAIMILAGLELIYIGIMWAVHFQIRLAKSAVVSDGLGLADNDVRDKIIAVQ